MASFKNCGTLAATEFFVGMQLDEKLYYTTNTGTIVDFKGLKSFRLWMKWIVVVTTMIDVMRGFDKISAPVHGWDRVGCFTIGNGTTPGFIAGMRRLPVISTHVFVIKSRPSASLKIRGTRQINVEVDTITLRICDGMPSKCLELGSLDLKLVFVRKKRNKRKRIDARGSVPLTLEHVKARDGTFDTI